MSDLKATPDQLRALVKKFHKAEPDQEVFVLSIFGQNLLCVRRRSTGVWEYRK